MKVVAVLPAFNAEKTVEKTCQAIPQNYVDEVVLVDDASTDNTVHKTKKISGLNVIIHKKNQGYGGNQKTCYTEALNRKADIIIMIHADFQYDPTYIPQMIAPIVEEKADMVIGSRFLNTDPRKDGMAWWRYWGNRFLTTVQNKVLGTNLSEGHSGYRAYTRKLLATIPYHTFSNSFVFDSEMLTAVIRNKMRVQETPIPTRYTTESSSISFYMSIHYGLATLWSLRPRKLKRPSHDNRRPYSLPKSKTRKGP